MATFRVYGVPIPQGSTRGFVHNDRAVITHANRKTLPWRQDIAGQALSAGVECVDGPVSLEVHFCMPRPKSLPKRVTEPDRRPDLDKLVRAVLDALTDIAWRDDSQVVKIVARKWYDTWVGADITIGPLPTNPLGVA